MTDLSPQAQAVLDAAYALSLKNGQPNIAAALRALVGGNAYEVEGSGWYSLVIDVDDIYAIADELEGDGPAVSDDREPASVIDQLNTQLYRRAKILFVRKVIDQAIRDTASVQWRVADTGEQLVRASDLAAWAEHMEQQMEQLND